MRVLIIDNYDSFTFNLYQYTGEILMSNRVKQSATDVDVIVKRNNEISIEGIKELNPDRIIISPGPGSPDDVKYFGVCSQVILKLGQKIPLMGVCLGMQGIAHCFGGRVVRAPIPMHGKISAIQHDSKGLFKEMPQNLEIMRYHSLMVEASSLPDCLEITSVINDSSSLFSNLSEAAQRGQVIMGVRHKEYRIEGIQFHPESFATEGAKTILANFLL
jgi:anthranilate synthase/aminodeoxychorismate synthase-like glutamine amidotransferase